MWLVRRRYRWALPIGAGRNRFWEVPWFTNALFTKRLSTAMIPVCPAFARAESSTFRTVRADALFASRRMVRASSILFPRIRSTTSRAFLGETRTNLSVAFASIGLRPPRRPAYFFTLAFRSPEWPWKVRVGENSPSLWPTMFSVTNTGMNLRPLCTAKVNPTMSGVMVDRLDQVLMIFLSFWSIALRSFRSRFGSTYGPFFTDRATGCAPFPLFPALHDVASGRLVLPGLVPFGRLSPRGAGMTSPR